MRWLYLSFLLVVTSLHAGQIVTTSDFGRIEEEIKKLDEQSLVLFDVDGTLIEPDDAILKYTARPYFYSLLIAHDEKDYFREIRLKAPHTVVDVRSIALIKELQEKNIPVLAFTAAPAKIREEGLPGEWRINELKQHGFLFTSPFPGCDFLELPKYPINPYFPIYNSGILFSSLHSKGDILITFLDMIDFKPNKVVFVDDELMQVYSVVATLEAFGIDCIGFHYTATINPPANFDPVRGYLQVKYFIDHAIWLSDDDGQLAQLLKLKFD